MIIFHQEAASMNSISKTVPAIAFGSLRALTASAEAISGGRITSIHAERTIFRLGEKTGDLSDLKTGQPAKVEFQRQDDSLILLPIGIEFWREGTAPEKMLTPLGTAATCPGQETIT
jgi:hypothetical protein